MGRWLMVLELANIGRIILEISAILQGHYVVCCILDISKSETVVAIHICIDPYLKPWISEIYIE